MQDPLRWSRVAAGIWLGTLLCVGLLAAPAAFAVLERPVAGRYVGVLFAREAAASLLLGAALLLLQRWQQRLAADVAVVPGVAEQNQPQAGWMLMLPAGAIFCTVLGYYGLQPWVDQARAGTGPLSFGQLHALSVAFFGVKALLVGTLVWKLNGISRPPASSL
jgi:uncharacterized membrane protein